jgi:hypothetical protein
LHRALPRAVAVDDTSLDQTLDGVDPVQACLRTSPALMRPPAIAAAISRIEPGSATSGLVPLSNRLSSPYRRTPRRNSSSSIRAVVKLLGQAAW